jgi:hypothetical protein
MRAAITGPGSPHTCPGSMTRIDWVRVRSSTWATVTTCSTAPIGSSRASATTMVTAAVPTPRAVRGTASTATEARAPAPERGDARVGEVTPQ